MKNDLCIMFSSYISGCEMKNFYAKKAWEIMDMDRESGDN